ncbi:hypothetical protein GWI33_004190 [Rhynchophorus ferrugineus]|uniref:Uncharacterized protein n=1 Tax=Rhynchophorus ferrugineus TaxID=354439 RepID=A0A834MP60_RHYFE|nr:hypothetical protein GWI33_004190 [Rhynchophorus ferrugineus]
MGKLSGPIRDQILNSNIPHTSYMIPNQNIKTQRPKVDLYGAASDRPYLDRRAIVVRSTRSDEDHDIGGIAQGVIS